MKKYYPEIDWLKGFAALLVILIHVLSRYTRTGEVVYLMWDIAHFGVGTFVLASGFLQANSPIKDFSTKGLYLWLKKRLVRIVLPYYMFVPFYLGAVWVVTSWDKLSSKFSWEYLWNTANLTSGVGNNWIPELFVWITLFYLGVELVAKLLKKEILQVMIAALVVNVGIATYLLVGKVYDLSSIPNVFSWLVIFIIGYIANKYWDNWKSTIKKILWPSAIIAVISYVFLVGMGESAVLFRNKYPPNIYFVAYNLLASVTVLGLFTMSQTLTHSKVLLQKGWRYISHASYDVFFYHLVVMKLFTDIKLGIALDFLVITVITLAVIYIKRDMLKVKI